MFYKKILKKIQYAEKRTAWYGYKDESIIWYFMTHDW